MILPKITKKQEQIVYLLYKFRFLSTHQIQQLINHKKPQYAQSLLKDLREKGYITTDYNPKSYLENTKPAIYYLASKARHILKDKKHCNISALNKIYNEKKRSEGFITHCMAIADLYLFFLSQKEENAELSFFTESELVSYEFLPHPLPSAYIAVKTKRKTRRYLLELFKDSAMVGNIRYRFREYLSYNDSGNWETHANGEAFPTILFICPTERKTKHIGYYAKAMFNKAYEEKFSFFFTSKQALQKNNKTNIWEGVSI